MSKKLSTKKNHHEPICSFCGRKLILYKQKWICGHGCIKPAIKPDEKLPEPCKSCGHFIPNINKLGHSYCWELDLKMAYDYPNKCIHFKPKKQNETKMNGFDMFKVLLDYTDKSEDPDCFDDLELELSEITKKAKEWESKVKKIYNKMKENHVI